MGDGHGIVETSRNPIRDAKFAFERWNVGGSEERFLSAQADAFAGAKAKEKVGLLRSE